MGTAMGPIWGCLHLAPAHQPWPRRLKLSPQLGLHIVLNAEDPLEVPQQLPLRPPHPLENPRSLSFPIRTCGLPFSLYFQGCFSSSSPSFSPSWPSLFSPSAISSPSRTPSSIIGCVGCGPKGVWGAHRQPSRGNSSVCGGPHILLCPVRNPGLDKLPPIPDMQT